VQARYDYDKVVPANFITDQGLLQRRGPDEKRPSPGGGVGFQEASFRDLPKWRTIVAISLFIVAALLIFVLLVQRARRGRAEMGLRLSEEKFSKVFRASPDAFAITRQSDGLILEVNDCWERISGYSRDEAMGRTMLDLGLFVNPEELQEFTRHVEQYGFVRDFETDFLSKEDNVVRAAVSAQPITIKGKAHLLIMVRDITERKRAEEARAQLIREQASSAEAEAREHQFRTLANSIPQLAWMADHEGYIFWYNQRWYDYTGTTLEQMQGWGWQKVHHPDEVGRVVEHIRRAFQSGDPWEDTFPLRSRDGEYRWFLSRALPIRDAEGRVVRWFGTSTDITEQREMEQRLRKSREELEERVAERTAELSRANDVLREEIAERERAEKALRESREKLRESYNRIENLAGRLIVAQEEERKHIARELHDDLNQQVAALAIGLGKLERQLPESNGPIHNQIAKLEDRTAQLSERIRRLSHELHSSTLEHVGLAEALKLHCSEFTDLQGISISFQTDGDIESLPSDVALCLYRVAQESLRNIAKHSGAKSAEVTLTLNGGSIELRIADRGRGFNPEEASMHHGLGLVSIVERIRLLGGRLEVKSLRGAGTELKVNVPVGASHD
jgi:PAS domain S-box-containing protein